MKSDKIKCISYLVFFGGYFSALAWLMHKVYHFADKATKWMFP